MNEILNTPIKKRLINKIDFIVVPSTHTQLCWFSLRLRGGSDFEKNSWLDHRAECGSFFLLSQMFFTSGDMMSQEELNFFQKKHAIEYSTVTSEAFFGFNLSFLKEKNKEMLKVLSAISKRKAFSSKEFELEKKELIFQLQRESESGEKLSEKAFLQHFFKDSPYEIDIHGNEKTVKNITTDSVWNLWENYFVPQGAVAVLAGQWESKEIKEIEKILEEILPPKKLKKEKERNPLYKKEFIDRFKKEKKRIIFEEYPKGKQTFIKLGFPIPSLKEKEIVLARIVQAFLTGMGGPLFHLRSESFYKNNKNLGGRAYVIGARLLASFGFGGLVFYTSLREEANKEWKWAIDSFLKETKKLCQQEISKEKVEEAKRALIASRYLRMGKIAYRAANYATYESYGLGWQRWENEMDQLKDVDAEDILKFCQKYLVEDNYIAHVFSPEKKDK